MRDYVIMFLILAIPVIVWECWHPKYQDKDYVNAIVGEAANQDEDTMICVAHALRNRGTLKGVYGYNSAHVKNENQKTWHKAWMAWDISKMEKTDPTNGARNFGTSTDLDEVGVDDPHILAHCGDFYFY